MNLKTSIKMGKWPKEMRKSFTRENEIRKISSIPLGEGGQ